MDEISEEISIEEITAVGLIFDWWYARQPYPIKHAARVALVNLQMDCELSYQQAKYQYVHLTLKIDDFIHRMNGKE